MFMVINMFVLTQDESLQSMSREARDILYQFWRGDYEPLKLQGSLMASTVVNYLYISSILF